MIATVVETWKAAAGAQFTDEEANLYGPAIEAIAERDGGATPDAVVEAARRNGSPLHGYFEWDDTIAGASWRKEQARHLVNHLRIMLIDEGAVAEMKAFFCVQPERNANDEGNRQSGSLYVPVRVVAAVEEYRAQVMQHALREARAWRARYREYQELQAIVAAIDAVAGD